MKACTVCKAQSFLDTCQKNAVHGKKREKILASFFLEDKESLHIFLVCFVLFFFFWQIFTSGEWTVTLTGNPTFVQLLADSSQADEQGKCEAIVLP